MRSDQRYWDEHARTDPMWAVLTDSSRTGGRWDAEEFFATGVFDIDSFFHRTSHLGLPTHKRTALDFGCGLGRLTQPLSERFEKTYGVDVSPVMLEQARKHNRKGDRCEYVWNPGTRLERFTDSSIDMIYCKLVLQHIPPRKVRAYLKEFLRVLAPGGLLWFQLPSRIVSPHSGISARIKFGALRLASLMQLRNAMYMNGIEREEVMRLLEHNGGKILLVEENRDSGPEYESFGYAVTR